MTESDGHQMQIFDLERRILRALSSGGRTSALREAADRDLAEYSWQNAEHGVVYDALRRIRSRDPGLLREQLPAEATRMGFPDIDWSDYFAALDDVNALTEDELSGLVRALKSKAMAPQQ